MHRLALILMIVLLPLRGWAGDAMVMQMASAEAAIESGAARAHEMGATESFVHQNQVFSATQAQPDCHEQLAGQSETNEASNNDHNGTCQACQACHTVALSPSPLEVTTCFTPPQLRPARAAAFTSAATALGQKPPIS